MSRKKIALIGYTGFVGSNLARQIPNFDGYNSQNIKNIQGKKYNLIISAGAKADRNEANNNPRSDWSGIKKLLNSLSKVATKHFILISTIDVYPNRVNVDEDTPIKLGDLTEPYGKNRFKMELFIKRQFPKVTIVRCPNLYGDNLKKNFLYDLIHSIGLEYRHKDSLLQFYSLKNLWKDIQKAVEQNIDLINLAAEPILAYDIALYTLGMNFQNTTKQPPLFFDFRTKYGKLFDSKDQYIYHKKEILKELKRFIVKERRKIKK